MTALFSTHTKSTLRREREIGGKSATAMGIGRRERRENGKDERKMSSPKKKYFDVE